MGNHPSSTAPKPASDQEKDSASSHDAGVSRPPLNKGEKTIMAMHAAQRVAVPPEESHASATRTSVVTNPQQVPSAGSSPATGGGGGPGSSASTPQQHPPKPPEEQRTATLDAPSKPVAVPIEPSSARSHHNVVSPEPSHFMPQNSVTDMSYLMRPPRLPLPIEEELHTPGSPILAPAEFGGVADLEALDADMVRKSSALSGGTSAEDEDDTDGEGLVVDKTRPTVPTTLRWLRGGDKIYVTGTICNWNRKYRLQPV